MHQQPVRSPNVAGCVVALFCVAFATTAWLFADAAPSTSTSIFMLLFVLVFVFAGVMTMLFWRPVVKLLIACIKNRRPPMMARIENDGGTTSKCPSCGKPIAMTKMVPGTSAFKCAGCGNEGTWAAEP
jgi:predicted RNA-binding Zn-ribbon protein involved in translation (DUF1610 family)